MQEQTGFSLETRNPDILTSIANLSSDEVFTPPSFANQMLDTVEEAWAKDNDGANIWQDKNVRFLDPFTKSGVFLREITRRLSIGLEKEIPDAQERVNHILTTQVFGVAITELTALLARRSVYCSKYANGEHSICNEFDTPQGNIWFERTEHTWVGGKQKLIVMGSDGEEREKVTGGRCKYCGAPQSELDRDKSRDNHAYELIHSEEPNTSLEKMFGVKMKFDVVVGNPPYQMKDAAGGGVDSAIYHLFVDMAKKLEPRYVSMVIPSRWLSGSTRGVGDFAGFRSRMLTDGHVRTLVDFPDSREVFPGVGVEGGVCYFLWDPSFDGSTNYTIWRDGKKTTSIRRLDQHDVFVREALGVQILEKVMSRQEESIIEILTNDTPFGIASNFASYRQKKETNDVTLYFSKSGKRDIGYVDRASIAKNVELIDKWKVLIPGARGIQKPPDLVIGRPWLCPPPAVCTQTFLAFFVDTREEAESLESYLKTKFLRFLVSLRKITQNGFRATYTFVPMQSWDREWTDEALFKKYKLTQDEIQFIESMIRPMELEDA